MFCVQFVPKEIEDVNKFLSRNTLKLNPWLIMIMNIRFVWNLCLSERCNWNSSANLSQWVAELLFNNSWLFYQISASCYEAIRATSWMQRDCCDARLRFHAFRIYVFSLFPFHLDFRFYGSVPASESCVTEDYPKVSVRQ